MARLDNVRVATNRIQLRNFVIGFSIRKTGFGYGRTWHDRIDTGASDVRAAVETFAWRQLEMKRQQCVSVWVFWEYFTMLRYTHSYK